MPTVSKCRAWFFVLCAALAVPTAWAVQTTADAASVRVTVAGKAALTLDRAALAALPRASATAATHGEPPSRWQGVALDELLKRAGAPSGPSLRGRGLASFVRVGAADGYQVVFSLGELDAALGHAQVILAETRDGQPLGKDGPFRLVVPGDQRAARWVRNVVTVEVVDGAVPAAGR